MNYIRSLIDERFMRWRGVISDILREHGWYMNADDVYRDCINCKRLLFENGEAFCVVNVVENDRDTRLFIMLAGGTMAGLDKLDPVIHEFGRSVGASKVGMIGRKGFLRVLAKRGWTSPHVYMEKEI